MVVTVAVIGAGALGLAALKVLREDGFSVTGYETRSNVGGLWQALDDHSISAHDSTVFNSSRFRSAYSDFAFSENVDDFPTAPQIARYLQAYAHHFELLPFIKLNTQVVSVTRRDDRWLIASKSLDTNTVIRTYDKVIVATGTFVKPVVPNIPNIEAFEGEVCHSIDFRRPHRFRGRNVLLLGLHASSQDIADSLYKHGASQVYVSNRSGVLLISRHIPSGHTFDRVQTLRFGMLLLVLCAWCAALKDRYIDRTLVKISAKNFDVPSSWHLRPAPSIAVKAPLVADQIWLHLRSGFVKLVSSVDAVIGSQSVKCIDGVVIDNLDVLIYCTGYVPDVSFLEAEHNPYTYPGATPSLFHGTFPLHSDRSVRESLAFVGHGAVAFPGLVAHEALAMAISQTWLGRSPLPPLSQMMKWHAQWTAWRKRLFIRHKRYPHAFLQRWHDHFNWLDTTAGLGFHENFGWSFTAWRNWWKDREFYRLCLDGIWTPALWRLFDTGKRKALPFKQARKQIIEENGNVAKAASARFAIHHKQT